MVANVGAKRLQRHARELSDATREKKEKTTKKSPLKWTEIHHRRVWALSRILFDVSRMMSR